MNEEVLKIINEPDQQFDSDIDLSLYDLHDLLEEEEVEVELSPNIAAYCVGIFFLNSMRRICVLDETDVLQHG